MVTTDRAGHTHIHTLHGALRVFMLMFHLWAKRKSDADKSSSESFLLHSSVMLTTTHRFEKEMYFCFSEAVKCLYVEMKRTKWTFYAKESPLVVPRSAVEAELRYRFYHSRAVRLCVERRLRHSSSSTTVAGRKQGERTTTRLRFQGENVTVAHFRVIKKGKTLKAILTFSKNTTIFY